MTQDDELGALVSRKLVSLFDMLVPINRNSHTSEFAKVEQFVQDMVKITPEDWPGNGMWAQGRWYFNEATSASQNSDLALQSVNDSLLGQSFSDVAHCQRDVAVAKARLGYSLMRQGWRMAEQMAQV